MHFPDKTQVDHLDFITWVGNHAPTHLNLGVFVVPMSQLKKPNSVISILKKKVPFVLVNLEDITIVVFIFQTNK